MTIPPNRWLADLERLLPIRSQFVVSGAIRDSFIVPLASGTALVPLIRAAWETLRLRGYRFLLVYDPADGLRVYPDEPAERDLASRLFDLKLSNGARVMVPPHVVTGTRIVVQTADGTYVERAKD